MNDTHGTSNLEPRTSNGPASHVGSRTAHVLVALALLVGVAYWNSLGNDFVLDDGLVILDNRLISHLENLPVVMVSGYWAGTGDADRQIHYFDALYRPFVIATYMLNYAAGGRNPVGFHLVNVGLHLLVTCLVYALARQLGLGTWASVISAALFGIHPIHTEAVTYVVGRAELMMAVGVLGSLWWAGQGRRARSVAAFAVGLLSKEQAMLLPLLVAFYEFCLGRGTVPFSSAQKGTVPLSSLSPHSTIKTLLTRYGIYLLVLVAYFGLRFYALEGTLLQPPGFLENPAAYAGWSVQVLTSIKVAGRYLWLFMWPASLSADYSYNAIPLAQSLLEPAVVGGLVFWLGLLGLAGWSLARGKPSIAFCAGMTLVTYLPISNLIVPIGTLMGERLFYLPSVGLCLLAGLAYERALSRNDVRRSMFDVQCSAFSAQSSEFSKPRTSNLERRTLLHALRLLLVVVCLAMTIRTVVRNRDWINHETLLERTVAVVPNNAKAHAMLGHALAMNPSLPAQVRAIEAYQTALSLYPDYVHRDSGVIGNVSALLAQTGRSAEAQELLERTIASDPDWGVLHYFLALHYARTGQPVKAEAEWRTAISLSPHIYLFRSVFGRFLIEHGRYAEGLAVAEEVLQDHPDFVPAVFNRALALQALGRFDDAATEYERVLALPAAPAAAKQDARRKLDDLRGCLPGLAGC